MKNKPYCLVYTRQDVLVRKARGLLHSLVDAIFLSESQALFDALQQHDPVVLIFDILTPDSDIVIRKIICEWPLTAVIILGEERSVPILSIQNSVFATESIDCPRQRFQTLVKIALKHIEVIQEKELIAAALNSERNERGSNMKSADENISKPVSVREALRSFTQFNDLHTLLTSSIEWLRYYKGLSNIGIFLREPSEKSYILKFGIKYPKEVSSLKFQEDDPLAIWLKYHPTVLNQNAINGFSNQTTQRHLTKALRAFFAEAIFPLHGAEGLLGWIFIGACATGKSYTQNDLLELTSIIDQLAFVLEKCIYHNRNEAQRVHFETVLQALPSGIVMFDEEFKINWLNLSAANIFQNHTAEIVGKRVESLGSELAAFIYRSRNLPFERSTMSWKQPQSEKKFLAEVHLNIKNSCGFMLLQDITPEILLQENDQKIQRAELATKLASRLSMEIRNPLVAIKTFAQLLPERYEDSSFRQRFVHIISHEVERLNQLSNGIRQVVCKESDGTQPMDLRDVLHISISTAIQRSKLQDGQIQTNIDSKPAPLWGNKEALTECFSDFISWLIGSRTKGIIPTISITISVKENEAGKTCCTIIFEGHYGKNLPLYPDQQGFSIPLWDERISNLNKNKRTIVSHRGQLRLGNQKKANYIMVELPLEN